MTARSVARVVSLIAGVAVVAVLALPGGAHANDMPPEPTTTIPAPPVNGEGNVRACELAYVQVRAEVLAEFRTKIQAAIADSDLVAIGDAVNELIEGLVGLNAGFHDCLVRVTPDAGLRAGLEAKPRHHGGGGGGSGSSCLGTYDKAVKKATRTEDRSFRKKHHTVTPQVAAATFDSAVTSAAQHLQSCLGA